MNRKEYISFILFVMIIAFPLSLVAQSDKDLVRKGNREFSNGEYNEAEINYRKALDKNSANTTAQFNLGDAMYLQEDYEKAAEVFSKTELKGKTSVEKSNVYYNYGNSLLKAGKGNEATAAYKQALRENPKNEEARYNLEYLRQKEKQDQNKDQNKEDKQDQDKQDQDKQDQENKDQQEQNKDEQEQNKDQEQNQDQQQQNQQDQNQEQGEQNEQQAQKISKKDAERMLEALKNNEKKTLENLKKAKKKNAKVIKSEKDW